MATEVMFYFWILFAVILYPWTKWGNKIVFFVLFKMRSDGFLVKWKWGWVPFSSKQFSTIYTLAGKFQDNCNCDGYATSIFTLSVSSASENGFHNCSHNHHKYDYPDYHHLRKKQVASLGTANNAAVLWPQLIAQAVAGIPGKYFFVKFETIWKWREFYASSSR